MSYPQPSVTGFISAGQPLQPPPTPPESLTQVVDQTQQKFALIENQVDEIIGRLFNFPRPAGKDQASATPPSTSERILELRSRAIRINEALATILDKL